MLPIALTPPQFLDGLLYALVFVTMISILVAAHEYGHYLFARLFKMGVEEFSIGMGKPVVWTYLRKTYETPEGPETTDFTLRAWPLGGFVRIKGMVPEEDGSEIHVPGGFYSRPPWQRFITLLAGPVFSILAGVIIIFGSLLVWGTYRPDPAPIVGGIVENGPAYSAGIRLGDKIVSVDGQPINQFFDIIKTIRDKPGTTSQVVYERDGQQFTTAVTSIAKSTAVFNPDLTPSGEIKEQGVWQMQYSTKRTPTPLNECFAEAVRVPIVIIGGTLKTLTSPKDFGESASGPAGLVKFTADAVKQGLEQVIWLSALLSISVGVFNLLPIHPLDGGQMVVAFAEMLRGGRRLSFKVQTVVSTVGLVLVLMLVVTATVGDVRRFTAKPKAPPEAGVIPADQAR